MHKTLRQFVNNPLGLPAVNELDRRITDQKKHAKPAEQLDKLRHEMHHLFLDEAASSAQNFGAAHVDIKKQE